ncbi:MAG: hypothetical protein WC683_11705 [bacterium]
MFADLIADTRYLGRGGRPFVEHDVPPLSRMLAGRVTSQFNKDAVLLLEGPRGGGKSMALLYLAWRTAQEISTILHGTPDRWREHFDIGRNVAVIDEDRVNELMGTIGKHQVLIADDVGAGGAWSSRKFMTDENFALNKILTIMRPQNNVLLISLPEKFTVDKVVRSFSTYNASVAESLHNKGITLIKVHSHRTMFQQGKTLFPYLQYGRRKIVRFIARLPPADLIAEYEKTRNEQTGKIIAAGGKRQEKPKVSKKEQAMQEHIDQYGDQIAAFKAEGLTAYQISKKIPLYRETVQRIMTKMEEL